MKLEKKLSKDWINGLEVGLQIAKDVAKIQGYNLIFPRVKDMEIETISKLVKNWKTNR